MLSVPKGTRDYHPAQVELRTRVLDLIRDFFQLHGAVSIDTPIFEFKSILCGQYGEDEKLVYDLLAEDHQTKLSLRYDHTVPLARYCKMNGISHLTRYTIGKVYRRDNPSIAQGRSREFVQCDLDIVGDFGSRKPDAECLKILADILAALQIGPFIIKLNHRCLIDGLLDVAGVPPEKIRTICSAIDKLDKLPWEKVAAEMLTKDISAAAIEIIGQYVSLKGDPLALLAQLRSEERFQGHPLILMGLTELDEIIRIIQSAWPETYACLQFDFSLCRGLTYYTGLVFEAVQIGQTTVGSLAGGGSYANLLKSYPGKPLPGVGFSIGVERIFVLLAHQLGLADEPPQVRGKAQVYIINLKVDDVYISRVADQLWSAGVSTTYSYQAHAVFKEQLAEACHMDAKVALILGSTELANDTIVVKDLRQRTQITVNRTQLIEVVQGLLQ